MRKRDNRKNRKETIKAFSMILQIGMTMMICMGISMGIGFYIDKLFGTKFWLIIMMVIGILASLRSMLVLTGAYRPGQREGKQGDVRLPESETDGGIEKGKNDAGSQD